MNQDWILHDSHDSSYREPFGAVPANTEITLRLKLLSHDDADRVLLKYRWEGHYEKVLDLSKTQDNGGEKVYECSLTVPGEPGLIWYYFEVTRWGRTYYYGNLQGLGGRGGISDETPRAYQITVYKAGTKVPDWFKDGVMYQIFVDRFCNGTEDGSILNPKPNCLIHSSWNDEPLYLHDRKTGGIARWNFFGGNLLGVRKKLAYLKSLGINVIYLNPIFESPSNHKYDTADYHKIDSMFGDEQLFRDICTEAREQGIAIILDGVFSHTGSDSIYFNKYDKYDSLGAFQSRESPFYRWYMFKDWPSSYDSWWGIDTLPNVNELEPSYQEFIITSEDSVVKHWMGAGIAGWRLDVVDEIPGDFLKKFRKTLKEQDPEAILIGEVWEDASHKESYGYRREYLLGDELDSVMNYPFRNILLDFMTGRRDAGAANLAMRSLCENYPAEHFYSAMNLIGSHDVPRALSILKGAISECLTPQFRDELAVRQLRLLALWQMTFPGVPCVYYGDEAQMEGWEDPQNRRTYPWGKENKSLVDWYREIIALRNHYDVLRTGQWIPLEVNEDVIAYLRSIAGGKDIFGQERMDNLAVVLINRSTEKQQAVSIDIRNWLLGGAKGNQDVQDSGGSQGGSRSIPEVFVDALRNYEEVRLIDGILNVTLEPLEGRVLLKERWGSHAGVKRESGVLLHPTSLPSNYGIGDMGKSAYEFVDYLAQGGQKLWQILPLNPPGYGGSPYACYSAFAGNTMLIDPEALAAEGLLSAEDLVPAEVFDADRVDFDKSEAFKEQLLRKAFGNFKNLTVNMEYEGFKKEHEAWLEDYALYMALKGHFGGRAWTEWDRELKAREAETMFYYKGLLEEEAEYQRFMQFIFFSQWHKLKEYANSKGIRIVGDLPIFVAHDSSDVWTNPQLFDLDEEGNPLHIAGVPPDYFSETGQRWGNPLYKWEVMEQDDYKWWRNRFLTIYEMVHIVRVDHFRGFEGYWEVPASEETAVNGRWVKGPGEKFFMTIRKYLGDIPIIAEDLGFITEEVRELKQKLNFPGMRIMQFEMAAWDRQYKLPLSQKCNIVYTGSHDNDTILGWYRANGQEGEPEEVCWRFIEMAYKSDADTVIIPLQDILCLGTEAKMNVPGTVEGNWQWRYRDGVLTPERAGKLASLVEKYRR